MKDRKQVKIWNEILTKFNLSDKAKLIQYRNLKEFRYFTIERINPNHIIELYGKLKNNNPKKNITHNIHVGRIIIPYLSIIFLLNSFSPIQVINALLYICSLMLISIVLLYICLSFNFMELIYDCINRRNNRFYKFGFR